MYHCYQLSQNRMQSLSNGSFNLDIFCKHMNPWVQTFISWRVHSFDAHQELSTVKREVYNRKKTCFCMFELIT